MPEPRRFAAGDVLDLNGVCLVAGRITGSPALTKFTVGVGNLHGTSTLFAALDIATGQVTASLKKRHRHQ